MNRHTPTPHKLLIAMVWAAAITWLLVMLTSCSLSRHRTPAKQQRPPHVTSVQNIDIPVEQIDTNRDGRISHTEASQIHMTNTTTPVVIFLCVGAATLFSCVICVWAARRIPNKSNTTTDSARSQREPAAPDTKTERLRRSNDK